MIACQSIKDGDAFKVFVVYLISLPQFINHHPDTLEFMQINND